MPYGQGMELCLLAMAASVFVSKLSNARGEAAEAAENLSHDIGFSAVARHGFCGYGKGLHRILYKLAKGPGLFNSYAELAKYRLTAAFDELFGFAYRFGGIAFPHFHEQLYALVHELT